MASDTLKQLEEFRRKKLEERQSATAAASTKSTSASALKNISSTSSSTAVRDSQDSTSGVPLPLVQRKRLPTGHPASQRTSPPIDSSEETFLQRILNWLYVLVMPENTSTERHQSSSEIDDESAEADFESDSISALDLLPPAPITSGIFAKLPRWMQYQYLWGLLAWCCGFALMIRFGWGAVYFTISVLLFVWKSLSNSRNRKPGALSAYSVFNPNCERIEGTLDAEQLQRQMFMRF